MRADVVMKENNSKVNSSRVRPSLRTLRIDTEGRL